MTVEHARRDRTVPMAREEEWVMLDVQERLATAAAGRLREVVRTALGLNAGGGCSTTFANCWR